MSITQQRKQELIKEYAVGKDDTGSVEVQCAVLTERIQALTGHMKENHKDFQGRRGLLVMVNRRRRLLKYLQRTNNERYQKLIKSLGLRK